MWDPGVFPFVKPYTPDQGQQSRSDSRKPARQHAPAWVAMVANGIEPSGWSFVVPFEVVAVAAERRAR